MSHSSICALGSAFRFQTRRLKCDVFVFETWQRLCFATCFRSTGPLGLSWQVSTHAYLHKNTHTYMHTYMHCIDAITKSNSYTYAHIHTGIQHAHTSVHTYRHTNIETCMHTSTNTATHTHRDTRAAIQTYMRTDTQTCTHTGVQS